MKKTYISYLQVVRLIFVIFSLYLVRDAFFRWDGIRINSSFLDFVPSIALMTILWSSIALIAATLLWLLLRIFEWFCLSIGWKVRMEFVLTFLGFSALVVIALWIGRILIMPHTPMVPILKWIFVFSILLGAIFLTWISRDKPSVVQERITPLVWLFGAITLLSFPIVIYHAWIKQEDIPRIEKTEQSATNDKINPNIILITFDALAARDMSVYGYHRQTTPFISEWSKNATMFTNAYAAANNTRPTTASLMTGKRVWTHRIYHVIEKANISVENLGRELKKNGYYTMAFTANEWANVEGLCTANSFDVSVGEIDLRNNHGLKKISSIFARVFENKILFYNWILQEDFILHYFTTFYSFDYNETLYPAELPINRFFSSIGAAHGKPFFAWIHMMPPHSEYLPPAPFMGLFDPSPKLRTFKPQHDIFMKSDYEIARVSQEFKENVYPLRARYDEFIRYSDSKFKYFIDQLQSRNLLGNTIIILSADHGESFQHDYWRHGNVHLYEQVTNIPLFIKLPDQKEGKSIHDLVEQVDIPVTILELAHAQKPSWMEGTSLFPLMSGDAHLLRPIFSMSLNRNPSNGKIAEGTVSVWENEYKLVYYLDEKKSLLFNLRQDPDEMNNLIDKDHELGQHLLGIIQDNLKKVNDKIKTSQ